MSIDLTTARVASGKKTGKGIFPFRDLKNFRIIKIPMEAILSLEG